MIHKREFYFVRHGQTDHNILEEKQKGSLREDIPLNTTGRDQAKFIEPTISSLPIQTVCASPLRRAQETKEIITPKLQVSHYEIHDLGECSWQIWKEMVRIGMYSSVPEEGVVRQFMDQVRKGINQALSFPGTSLVVAHGGIHWAICCLMGIHEHEWEIGNCVPVHFFLGDDGQWKARKLIDVHVK